MIHNMILYENKNNYIFWLYHLGISIPTLSIIYLNLECNDLKRIYDGHFADYYMSRLIPFTQKDISLITNQDLVIKSKQETNNFLKKFNANKVIIKIYFDDDFPKHLLHIPNPPFLLFVRGNYHKLNETKLIAVAGSRQISDINRDILSRTVVNIVKNNFGTVSGLAYGTDIITNSLTAKLGGYTVAVLPGSILSIIPSAHKQQADQILDSGGLLISEFYTTNVSRKNFITRNRIISGLGDCLLLPELRSRSGTMHTARYAWKQKKKIFCFDNQSSGIKKILNSGQGTIYKNIEQFAELYEN